MLYEELTKQIIHAAHLVHNELGFGFLEAVSDLKPEHEWQLLNYLTACKKEVGLLINFGHSVKVKRKIITQHNSGEARH